MKTLKIKLLKKFKSYKENFSYSLTGDLIILSGVNGSGKTQLLRILSNTGDIVNNVNFGSQERQIIERKLECCDGEKKIPIETIKMLGISDSISISQSFGEASAYNSDQDLDQAWNFYNQNIKNASVINREKLIHSNTGRANRIINDKNPAHRSILQIVNILDEKFGEDEKKFNLDEDEFKSLLPNNFIWKYENHLVEKIGDIFYKSCVARAKQQIKFSETEDMFDKESWLKTAPWTILNDLFKKLNFKYRFKRDYEFDISRIKEQPKLLDDTESRKLMDLSDGEKAILKLALFALDIDTNKDIQLMLFDEYDAPLNPSLVESFYKVVEDFYIKKNIQVIISTHSPTTISLAPEYAQFYEIFTQTNDSPKIIGVDRLDYEELKIANKKYYDKLQNPEKRISQLEGTQGSINHKNSLFVEDKYLQIYKISYLKLKNIPFDEDSLDDVFKSNSNFDIHGEFGADGLRSFLLRKNVTYDADRKNICLFDFDIKGYSCFETVIEKKDNNGNKIFNQVNRNIKDGVCYKHKDCERYMMLLPIPDRLEKFVSLKTSNDCFIEVETLISENFLKSNNKAHIRSKALEIYIVDDRHKKDFWKTLIQANKDFFEDFKPLFKSIENIFSN